MGRAGGVVQCGKFCCLWVRLPWRSFVKDENRLVTPVILRPLRLAVITANPKEFVQQSQDRRRALNPAEVCIRTQYGFLIVKSVEHYDRQLLPLRRFGNPLF